MLVRRTIGIYGIQSGSVYQKYIFYCGIQQSFQLRRIEEQSKTLIAPFNEKGAVEIQIDGFQLFVTARAGAGLIGFMGGIVMYPPEIHIIAVAAISAQQGAVGQGGFAVGASGHGMVPFNSWVGLSERSIL